MSTIFNDQISLQAPKTLDARSAVFENGATRPYNDLNEAITTIQFPSIGLDVFISNGIGGADKYTFTGGVDINSLIKQPSPGDYSDSLAQLGQAQNNISGLVQQISNVQDLLEDTITQANIASGDASQASTDAATAITASSTNTSAIAALKPHPVIRKTTDYTLVAADFAGSNQITVEFDTTGGGIQFTLPVANTIKGWEVFLILAAAAGSPAPVTVKVATGQVINYVVDSTRTIGAVASVLRFRTNFGTSGTPTGYNQF